MVRREAALRSLLPYAKVDYDELEKSFAFLSTAMIEEIVLMIRRDEVQKAASAHVAHVVGKSLTEAFRKAFFEGDDRKRKMEIRNLILPSLPKRKKKSKAKPIRREPFYSKFVTKKRR